MVTARHAEFVDDRGIGALLGQTDRRELQMTTRIPSLIGSTLGLMVGGVTMITILMHVIETSLIKVL